MSNTKQIIVGLLAIVSVVSIKPTSAMGGIKQLFAKNANHFFKTPAFVSIRNVNTIAEQHNLELPSKKIRANSSTLNELNHMYVLKKEQKQKLKKSALWGFSSFNGLIYSLGFALNPEILQPVFQTTTGLILGTACFSAVAAYNAKQYFKQKKAVEMNLEKIRDQISVS